MFTKIFNSRLAQFQSLNTFLSISDSESANSLKYSLATVTYSRDRYPAALARLYCYPGMPPLHPYAPPCHFYYPPPRFSSGHLMRSDDGNTYTTLEPTFSSNPNVYFQRNDGGVHPGMMY